MSNGFIEYAGEIDYGYDEFYVHPGATYEEQILMHSAVLARRIMTYLPELADDIKWNPWDPSDLLQTIGWFLENFSSYHFPIYDLIDGLSGAVSRLNFVYPVAQGFQPWEDGPEQHYDGALSQVMVVQAIAEEAVRSGYKTNRRKVIDKFNLPEYDLHRLTSRIRRLVSNDHGVGAFSLEEARASAGAEDLSIVDRLRQFLFVLDWFTNSTGIVLMDIDHETMLSSDDPVDLDNIDWVNRLSRDWYNGVVYFDVLRDLNKWTLYSEENLEALLHYVRRAGDMAILSAETTAADLADTFLGLCVIVGRTILDVPPGYWQVASDFGVKDYVIDQAKMMVRDAYDTDAIWRRKDE